MTSGCKHSILSIDGWEHYRFLGKALPVPTLRTLAIAKTILDDLHGRKMTPSTCILNMNCSKETTIVTLAWSKISKWDRQTSTTPYEWGINWYLRQKTLVEKKTCTQCWWKQCRKVSMNNSKCLTRWLT